MFDDLSVDGSICGHAATTGGDHTQGREELGRHEHLRGNDTGTGNLVPEEGDRPGGGGGSGGVVLAHRAARPEADPVGTDADVHDQTGPDGFPFGVGGSSGLENRVHCCGPAFTLRQT